jgi:hypothetical protein
VKNKTCFEIECAGFEIRLTQQGVDRFTVTYEEAASELGSCLMHAAACEGKLDNRERGEK